MRQDIDGKEAEDVIADGSVPAEKFTWYAVSSAVGNQKNQGPNILMNL